MADNHESCLLGIAAGATVSPNAANEDAFAITYSAPHALRAAFVADGVGSAERAAEASQFLVARINAMVSEATAPLDFPSAYVHLRDAIDARGRQEVGAPSDSSRCVLASTLIGAVEYEHHFDIAYLGNGAIWHLRGNFDQFRETQYLPWNAINYLNPHSNQDHLGRESLYKSFAVGATDEDVLPTSLRLSKDDRYGDIVMICTDGVYSFDQVRIGRAPDNSIWIPGDPLMIRFFAALKGLFSASTLTVDSLSDALSGYLEEALDEQLLEDDATIAVLVTAAAVRYQSRRAREWSG